MNNNKITIEYKKLDEVTPYINNPRNNDAAVDKVASSIAEFGFKVPIVIDRDGIIVTGHTRYKASRKLGLEEIPCIYADDLTPEQIKAFRIADNKTSEFASWDNELLKIELGALQELNFDLSETGFAEWEIDTLLLEDIELDVSDEDFLKDTEITKEKEPKKMKCPHCGEVITL